MTAMPGPDLDREQQLNEILLAYVEAVEDGQAPDRRHLQERYPNFAAELAEFFASNDRLERLAAPLRQAARAAQFSEEALAGSPGFAENLWLPPDGKSPLLSPPFRLGSSGPASELGRLGDFRLLREIGRGGMGIVYEAEQISLNRRVALKVLPFAAALDPKQLQRFKNEAQAAAVLHHNNIVPVHAVGCERGVHYYAMQFIEGQSLAALIHDLRRQAGHGPADDDNPTSNKATVPGMPGNQNAAVPLPPTNLERTASSSPTEGPPRISTAQSATLTAALSTEHSARGRDFYRRVAHLGMKAAEALEHAHQLGVIHRDIKPANLLIDVRGNLWITDFGLALLLNSGGLTTTGELVGTLRYMSPEQTCGRPGLVDHRTDIYSLGVTLYELLTLEPLFPAQERHHLLHEISFEEPRAPRAIDRSIPVELETILLKALAKNSAERYASAQEMADDLQRFLDDKPVQARRPTYLDRARKWSRRHRTLVGSAVVLLLLTTAGLLVSTVLIAHAHLDAKEALERERLQRLRAEANFDQARRIVDFVTQITEEELVDKPGLFEVRRKLLEASLEYYQDFIDQCGDDPSLQAELAASRTRVEQILGELSAQQGYSHLLLRTMLLGEPEVQKELQITPAQKEKIAELNRQLSRQRHEVFWILRKLPPLEQQDKFAELGRANEQAVAAILNPVQDRRLKQIALQQRGPLAFDDPEVGDALGLTKAQKSRLRDIQEEARKALRQSFPHGSHSQDGRHQIHEFWNRTQEKILALLTPDQQGRWKEMTGEPFQGEIRFLQ